MAFTNHADNDQQSRSICKMRSKYIEEKLDGQFNKKLIRVYLDSIRDLTLLKNLNFHGVFGVFLHKAFGLGLLFFMSFEFSLSSCICIFGETGVNILVKN